MNILKQCLVEPGSSVKLEESNASNDMDVSREEATERLAENAEAIRDLQHMLYAEHQRALLVVLQAMDAGGKDSTIRAVFSRTNPQAVHVKSFKRPTDEERNHDFLWRVYRAVPGRGHIGIFNRSHYEDVLVARVDGIVPESVWSTRYDAINAFEAHLANTGTHIVKIYLQISKARQREKLVRRITDPQRNWKFEPQDFETRKKWDRYMEAYEDVLTKCSTPHAPWYVVPSDHKWFRLYAVSEIIRQRLEAMAPAFPPARIDPEAALRLIDQLD